MGHGADQGQKPLELLAGYLCLSADDARTAYRFQLFLAVFGAGNSGRAQVVAVAALVGLVRAAACYRQRHPAKQETGDELGDFEI